MERCAIVIPARYQSSRLPGKPLADILGKPMVQHVYERALAVPNVDNVFVATDDARIFKAVQGFGGRCVLTSPDHPSGTDRLTEAMRHAEAEIYVNLQGDEPLVRTSDISVLVDGMRTDSAIQVGTLCHRITAREALDPNTVKVVLSAAANALYFSRAAIPYQREGGEPAQYFKHVGVYAYRRELLERYASLPRPMIERAELLEQLRLLAVGISIRVFEVGPVGPGVDTPEGLEIVRAFMEGQRGVL